MLVQLFWNAGLNVRALSVATRVVDCPLGFFSHNAINSQHFLGFVDVSLLKVDHGIFSLPKKVATDFVCEISLGLEYLLKLGDAVVSVTVLQCSHNKNALGCAGSK